MLLLSSVENEHVTQTDAGLEVQRSAEEKNDKQKTRGISTNHKVSRLPRHCCYRAAAKGKARLASMSNQSTNTWCSVWGSWCGCLNNLSSCNEVLDVEVSEGRNASVPQVQTYCFRSYSHDHTFIRRSKYQWEETSANSPSWGISHNTNEAVSNAPIQLNLASLQFTGRLRSRVRPYRSWNSCIQS